MTTSTGTCYLSGPMTGYPKQNFPAFFSAQTKLEQLGWTVLNPAAHEKDNADLPLADLFKWDIAAVLRSDAVVVLPGWKDSAGACTEVDVALKCGIPVYRYGGNDATTKLWPLDTEPDTCLEEAQRLVDGPRQASYGHPREDFARTAQMWSVILGVTVRPEQVPLCQVALKISREVNAHKRDNIVDICGYARTLELCLE